MLGVPRFESLASGILERLLDFCRRPVSYEAVEQKGEDEHNDPGIGLV